MSLSPAEAEVTGPGDVGGEGRWPARVTKLLMGGRTQPGEALIRLQVFSLVA